MPKYPKSPPNKTFDGKSGTYYDSGYEWSKVEFLVDGCHLNVTFHRKNMEGRNNEGEWRVFKLGKNAPRHLKKQTIVIEHFRAKSVCQVLNEHGDELGRHYEDGLKDVYRFFRLPFGHLKPVLRTYNPSWEFEDI